MIKTLSKARKQERVKFLIPRSVQDCIPIRRIWADGIFQVGHQFSKTWSFTDINYSIAGKDDKTAMFLDYCDLLNAAHLYCGRPELEGLLASLLHYGIHTFGAKDGNWIEPGGRRWMVLPGYDEEVWNG